MKKLKIILCLNLFVLLFIIQGCGKINQKNNTSKTKKSNVNYSLLDKYNPVIAPIPFPIIIIFSILYFKSSKAIFKASCPSSNMVSNLGLLLLFL